MKAGDKVYVGRSASWSVCWTEGKVVKVTPSGMVDVELGLNVIVRFRNGREVAPHLQGQWLDDKPFEERVALLAQEDREKEAVALIRKLFANTDVRYGWGKEELLKEVLRLQERFSEVKNAVNAI